MSDVTVEWGHIDPYWDVFVIGFSSPISVRIDEATGGVSLNPGYQPHTALYDHEVTLFQRNREGIVAALAETLRDNDQPEYEAFRARFASSSSPAP